MDKGIKIGLNPIRTTIQFQQDDIISSFERSIGGILLNGITVSIKNRCLNINFLFSQGLRYELLSLEKLHHRSSRGMSLHIFNPDLNHVFTARHLLCPGIGQ